ncbi:MAG: Coenzyme F420 hydrogenase/dehydrogenase, beta subunit C-terminal domain [Promethearchaeia archaeon]
MSNQKLENKITKEYLKRVADALESYRVRALIDAKQEILDAGVYSESEYEKIFFKMFDEEEQKYSLLEFLNSNQTNGLNELTKFSEKYSIPLRKTLGYLELLNQENLIDVDYKFEKRKREENTQSEKLLKEIKIKINDDDISELKSIYEPVKVIFDSETCSGCGLCAGICPMDCISIENGFGEIDDDMCVRCGLCYFVCPRSYLPVDILNLKQSDSREIKDYGNIGPFMEAYCAQTKVDKIKEVCQDGGISTTSIYYLLNNEKIDYALGATMSERLWCPEPKILQNEEDLIAAAGTKYVNNPNLSLLNKENLKDARIAAIGVPCQMQALLKSNLYNIGIPTINNVIYRIGIFCMESFPYEEGFLKICEKLDVDVHNVTKTDINKGKFFVYTRDGEEHKIAINEISALAREDCEVCFDLTSESADISIGSIGAPSGWNAVLIRTPKGRQLYNALLENDLIESKPLDHVKPGLPLLKKIAGFKRKDCRKAINEKNESNARAPSY